MRGIRGARPSPTLVIAVLALVAGMTGVAVADPENKKAVTKKKVVKIADKEIEKAAPGLSVASAASADNAAALDGVGPSGFVSSDIVTRFKNRLVFTGAGGDVDVGCNPGEQIIGGGARMAGVFASEDVTLVSSRPDTSSNGGPFTRWHASGRNGEPETKTLTAYAVCAR